MLKLTLKAGEKIILNGAVLRAERRCELVLENRAQLLRGRDVLPVAGGAGPAELLYRAIAHDYVDPDHSAGHQAQILAALDGVMGDPGFAPVVRECAEVAQHLARGNHYAALAPARAIVAHGRAAAELGAQPAAPAAAETK